MGEGFMAPWTPQQQQPGGLYAPLGWKPTAPGPMPAIPTGEVPVPGAPAQSIWEELGIAPPVQPLTYEEALAKQKQLGPDYYIDYDEASGGYTVQRKPFGLGPQEPTTYPKPMGPEPTDPYGRKAWWNVRLSGWDYPPDWGVDPAALEAGYAPPGAEPQWRPGELDLQQQQMAQQAQQQQQMIEWYREQQQAALGLQQQQMLASLRAQPASWLEYASLAGETPAIQPWMLPLMPQEYASLQAGAPLPGWQAGGESLAGLPELTRPSAQYLARMSPSAREQYAGYRQARTGMTPADIGWRQWTAAPPTGGFGLRYTR